MHLYNRGGKGEDRGFPEFIMVKLLFGGVIFAFIVYVIMNWFELTGILVFNLALPSFTKDISTFPALSFVA